MCVGVATGKGLGASIKEDGEVIGRNIVCEPLIDEEDGLGTRLMGSSGSNLDVVTEPAMVRGVP
ncbi:LuxR family transcriptional regulator [Sesbania bispinosa]|nr:LuxR family transcriptional regulator [Sesbania bispinosa]